MYCIYCLTQNLLTLIVKNLSRKNESGRAQLLRYIFKYMFKDGKSVELKPREEREPYWRTYPVPGIRLTAADRKHLNQELWDARFMKDLASKYPDNNLQAYLENYVYPGDKRLVNIPINSPFVIRHNMPGNTIKEFVQAFEKNEAGRIHKRVDQTSVHHTIISWSAKDTPNISYTMLRDISREYIRLRGEKNLYVGNLHTDREHLHLHIAMSATTIDGKSSRVSRQEFEQIKVQLQEYSMRHYPEIKHSIVQHGKLKLEREKEAYIKNIRNERNKGKEVLAKVVETTYSKSTSTEHFFSLLKESNYSVYYRNSAPTGIITEDGYKYRFSRLNVDLEHLHQLSLVQAKEAEHLKDLKELRVSTQHERELLTTTNKENETAVDALSLEDQKELEELRDIRDERDTDYERNLDDFEWDISNELDTRGYAEIEDEGSEDPENDTGSFEDNLNDTNENLD